MLLPAGSVSSKASFKGLGRAFFFSFWSASRFFHWKRNTVGYLYLQNSQKQNVQNCVCRHSGPYTIFVRVQLLTSAEFFLNLLSVCESTFQSRELMKHLGKKCRWLIFFHLIISSFFLIFSLFPLCYLLSAFYDHCG